MRQVQTSNTVYVTAPHGATNDAHGTDEQPPVCALGTCTYILELTPATGSPLPFLQKALPVFNRNSTTDMEVDSEDTDSAEVFRLRREKQKIFDDVPFSDQECDATWPQLCPIYHEGRWCRPDVTVLLEEWQRLIKVAKDSHIDFGSKSGCTSGWGFFSEVVNDLYNEGQKIRGSIAGAIVKLFSNGNKIDRAGCVRIVGGWCLEQRSRTNNGPIPTKDFVSMWEDYLPLPWIVDCDTKLLQHCSLHPTATTIQFKDPSDEQPQAGAKGVVPAKRKWHEKFKKGRG